MYNNSSFQFDPVRYDEINGETNYYLVVNGKFQSNYTGYYDYYGNMLYIVNGILQ